MDDFSAEVQHVSASRIHQTQSYIGFNSTDIVHKLCQWTIHNIQAR